ncbi:MAG: hypothetical protein SGI86_22725 [Deltaproteobacteria bacterium]|nr:hypothetical protein [Deltaproteobacteria bacterium]
MSLSWFSRTSFPKAVAAALPLLFACGSSQKKAAESSHEATADLVWGLGSLDRSRCNESGKQIVTGDTDKDNKPDVWKLYVPSKVDGADVQALVCKQTDLNHDGKVDMVEHHEGGALLMAEYDFDYDAKFDQTDFRKDGKIVRKERDFNVDQRPDHIEYYEGDKLARIERDSDFDGRVDEWQYYENGELDRIGYDTKNTGKPDKWDRAAEKAPETVAAPPPAEPAAASATTAPPSAAK